MLQSLAEEHRYFSIQKRLFLCKAAQLLLQGKSQQRDQGNGCHINEGRISWDYQQPPAAQDKEHRAGCQGSSQ